MFFISLYKCTITFSKCLVMLKQRVLYMLKWWLVFHLFWLDQVLYCFFFCLFVWFYNSCHNEESNYVYLKHWVFYVSSSHNLAIMGVSHPWLRVQSSVQGCDTASEECVLNFQTRGPVWLCTVSVWHVPARCTSSPRRILICFCWSAGPHIWATWAVWDREPERDTSWDAEVLRLQSPSWNQAHSLTKRGRLWGRILGTIWWKILLL